MYTLYHAKGACSTAIIAALALARAEYKIELLNLSTGDQKTEAYLKINPFAKVPAFDTGTTRLTEGIAIQSYLADTHPGSGLLPASGDSRYQAIKWLSAIYASVHPHFSALFSPEKVSDDTDSVRQKASEALLTLFKVISEQLTAHRFISGDEVTAADLYLAVQLHWSRALSLGLLHEYPVLNEYLIQIHKHPVIGPVFEQEFPLQ